MSEILIGDDKVITMPIGESGEPFVDAAEALMMVDHRLADEHGLYRRVRVGVLRRLQQASEQLPSGWRIAVIEAYRPISTQRRYFQDYLATLAAENPTLDADELHRLATRHIAPVLDDGHPPHSTGGAVDLTVYGPDGEVPMGCPVNATPEQSGGACYTDATGLLRQERDNRDALIMALESAGLVNYSPEWWHWSYGDQYWALRTGAATTIYARASEHQALS